MILFVIMDIGMDIGTDEMSQLSPKDIIIGTRTLIGYAIYIRGNSNHRPIIVLMSYHGCNVGYSTKMKVRGLEVVWCVWYVWYVGCCCRIFHLGVLLDRMKWWY